MCRKAYHLIRYIYIYIYPPIEGIHHYLILNWGYLRRMNGYGDQAKLLWFSECVERQFEAENQKICHILEACVLFT